MLGGASGARYVYEPLNPKWNPALEDEIRHFEYLTSGVDASDALKGRIDRAFSGRQTRQQLLRAAYRHYFWSSIRPFDRVVVKDPTAVLMADWIAARYSAKVLVVIRHPCAFVSSIMALGWRLSNFRFLDQPQLMSDYLQPFEAMIRRAEADPWTRAAAVWSMINLVLLGQLEHHPDWVLCKYEELCVDSASQFAALGNKLGLDIPSKRYSGSEQPNREVAGGSGSTNMISSDMPYIWKERLSGAQVDAVLGVVSEFGLSYLYPDHPE